MEKHSSGVGKMPDKSVETVLELHEQHLSIHDEALKLLNVKVDVVHDWQVELKGQLSTWRWLAPILASVISSVLTALILRSVP